MEQFDGGSVSSDGISTVGGTGTTSHEKLNIPVVNYNSYLSSTPDSSSGFLSENYTPDVGLSVAGAGKRAGAEGLLSTLVRRVVFDHISSPNVSIETQKIMQKYLCNPSTIDIVYEKIIDALRQDRNKTQSKLARVIKLLKSHLIQYVPSGKTLAKLDGFLATIIPDDESSMKSILFVRSVIASQLISIDYVPAAISSKVAPPSANRIPSCSPTCLTADYSTEKKTKHLLSNSSRRHSWHYSPNLVDMENQTKNQDVETKSVSPTNSDILCDGDQTQIILNLFQHRIEASNQKTFSSLTKVGSKKVFRRSASGNESKNSPDMFGAQFSWSETIESDSSNQSNTLASPFKEPSFNLFEKHNSDMNLSMDKIRQIMKKEQNALYKRRIILKEKRPQLFHYKYYKNQAPLEPSNQDMKKIVSAVMRDLRYDPKMTASKILIKILMDVYAHNEGDDAKNVILSLLSQMMKSRIIETRIHAWNLLFNLSVHLNMFEKVSILLEEKDVGSQIANNIQEELYEIILELIKLMIDEGLTDEKDWSVALSCFLFFTTRNGKICRNRILKVQPRCIAKILEHSEFAGEETQRHLIQILTNILYSEKALNIEYIHNDFPIEMIVKYFCFTRSWEVRDNLFVIMFDYILSNINISVDSYQNKLLFLLDLFRETNTVGILTQLFKHIPENFVEKMVAVYDRVIISWDSTFYDVELLKRILQKFEGIAESVQQISEEGFLLFHAILQESDSGSLDQLRSMIYSDIATKNRKGKNILVQLLKTNAPVLEMAIGSEQLDEHIPSFIQMFLEMSSSSDEFVRRTYLEIVEQLSLFIRSKVLISEEQPLDIGHAVKFLGSGLERLVDFQERSRPNLLFMFDIILEFTMLRPDGSPMYSSASRRPFVFSEDNTSNPSMSADNTYEFCSCRLLSPSEQLLSFIDLRLLLYLFLAVPRQLTKVRAAILILTIEKCRADCQKSLQRIQELLGDQPFFETLVQDMNTEISYLASRFLIDLCEKDRPEEYRELLTSLLDKARETEDEHILSNPFLQVRAIMQLHTSPRS